MFQKERVDAFGEKIFVPVGGLKVARTYLYVLKDDLHKRPFGIMKDLSIDERYLDQDLESKLIGEVVRMAQKYDCRKLICIGVNSDEFIQEIYKKAGFTNHGLEFRMDFD